eukprot:9137917-Pyramimonas_sp.AAC.1
MGPAVCLTFPVAEDWENEGGDGGVMKTILRSAPDGAEAPSKENYVCVGTSIATQYMFMLAAERSATCFPFALLTRTTAVFMQCTMWGHWRMGHNLIAAEKTINRAYTCSLVRAPLHSTFRNECVLC